MNANKYLVIYEPSSTGFGAYAPDLPGCVATGRSMEETRARMTKAMEMHLAGMREDGQPIPEPSHFELLETA
jgi:predicted RNase H-like HicB family nuclease